MKLCGLCKTGSLGAIADRGGHRSRRYRRLWHVEEHRACQPPFAEIPGYSLNEAGQLQGFAVSGPEPKLLVSHQSALAYYT